MRYNLVIVVLHQLQCECSNYFNTSIDFYVILQQVKQGEESSRELSQCKEQITAKEKEYLTRQEWYEHKVSNYILVR